MEQPEESQGELEVAAFAFLNRINKSYPTKCTVAVVLADQFVACLLDSFRQSRSQLEQLRPPFTLWATLSIMNRSIPSLCDISEPGVLIERLLLTYRHLEGTYTEGKEFLKKTILVQFHTARSMVLEMPMNHTTCCECYRLHPKWKQQYLRKPDEN